MSLVGVNPRSGGRCVFSVRGLCLRLGEARNEFSGGGVDIISYCIIRRNDPKGYVMIRVLFVCLGNICRSPMAEAVFMHKVRAAGLENVVEADSAGTGHWQIGNPPHSGTRAVLAQNGIEHAHRARLIVEADLDAFDYVLTMDDQNLRDVRAIGAGRAVLQPFLAYAPGSDVREVPDPYLVGGFEGVYALVNEASEGLLKAIREQHGL